MSVNFHHKYDNSRAELITFHNLGGVKDEYLVSGSAVNKNMNMIEE
jgi:hypothetical protein